MSRLIYIFSLTLLGCAGIGDPPDEDHVKGFTQSKNYDQKTKRFINRRQNEVDLQHDNFQFWEVLKHKISGGEVRVPSKPFPVIRFSREDWEKDHQFKFIWLGHSTILMKLNGKTILFDPVFSDYASPIKFINGRFQKPPISLKDLPEIDYIVISHDHYDHLDMGTIKFFRNNKTKFLTPLGVGSYLKGWGIEKERISELDWWESKKDNEIEFTCTPQQHFSGRFGMINSNPTLWSSWAVTSEKKKVYFSGDGGYDIHFKEIGNRLGPFDYVFMENGQYSPYWKMSHVRPEEGIQAFRDLKGKYLIPIHWGMFNMALHSWDTPISTIWRLSNEKGVNLINPKLGELITQGENFIKTPWWQLIK